MSPVRIDVGDCATALRTIGTFKAVCVAVGCSSPVSEVKLGGKKTFCGYFWGYLYDYIYKQLNIHAGYMVLLGS